MRASAITLSELARSRRPQANTNREFATLSFGVGSYTCFKCRIHFLIHIPLVTPGRLQPVDVFRRAFRRHPALLLDHLQ